MKFQDSSFEDTFGLEVFIEPWGGACFRWLIAGLAIVVAWGWY